MWRSSHGICLRFVGLSGWSESATRSWIGSGVTVFHSGLMLASDIYSDCRWVLFGRNPLRMVMSSKIYTMLDDGRAPKYLCNVDSSNISAVVYYCPVTTSQQETDFMKLVYSWVRCRSVVWQSVCLCNAFHVEACCNFAELKSFRVTWCFVTTVLVSWTYI